jgi:hypothetical protein
MTLQVFNNVFGPSSKKKRNEVRHDEAVTSLFTNQTRTISVCDKTPEHTYEIEKTFYGKASNLTDALIETVDGDLDYPWMDGEKGHVQTLVDYQTKHGYFLSRTCDKCFEGEAEFKDGGDELRINSSEAMHQEFCVYQSPVILFSTESVVNGTGSCSSTRNFYFPEVLTIADKSYRLVSRIYSTQDTGSHFTTQSYFDLPTPGIYGHDCMRNEGIAVRKAEEGGFHGRTQRGWCVFYTVN